jgi:hydrogenase expression/formation protein HypE
MKDKQILIGHGSGGKLSHRLINELFIKHFSNPFLNQLNDSSVFELKGKAALTTDSYVIDPIFFPGGDIGKLAISGTINDLLTCGAKPMYLSAGFIIEEGFETEKLETIVHSMAEEAKVSQVSIITGDTKVVKKGQCDKIFINTTGVGSIHPGMEHLSLPPIFETGDAIIVSGFLGDHAIAVLAARNNIQFEQQVLSDVAPMVHLVEPVLKQFGKSIRFIRDITRGGLATVLNEIAGQSQFCFELEESKIPVRTEIQGICEVFGYDPLYLANEGKMVFIVANNIAESIVEKMQQLPFGKDTCIVGSVTEKAKGKVLMKSIIGGNRIVDMLTGEMLPRIC